MSYEKFYPNGWQSGETGGTPITPEALNHIENGIKQTYSDLAPAGYGYGDPITITISNTQTGDELDFDTALEAVFSQMQNYSCRQVQFTDFSSGVGDVFTGTLYKNWADYGWLIGTSYSGYTMQKVKRNGAWHNREWFNPPMVLGVEYRTTEQWQGRAVYCRMINIGALPNSTMKNTPIDFGVTHMVRYEGVTNAGDAIPYVYSTNRIELACEPTYVRVTTTADYSYLQAYITLYYTKD